MKRYISLFLDSDIGYYSEYDSVSLYMLEFFIFLDIKLL